MRHGVMSVSHARPGLPRRGATLRPTGSRIAAARRGRWAQIAWMASSRCGPSPRARDHPRPGVLRRRGHRDRRRAPAVRGAACWRCDGKPTRKAAPPHHEHPRGTGGPPVLMLIGAAELGLYPPAPVAHTGSEPTSPSNPKARVSRPFGRDADRRPSPPRAARTPRTRHRPRCRPGRVPRRLINRPHAWVSVVGVARRLRHSASAFGSLADSRLPALSRRSGRPDGLRGAERHGRHLGRGRSPLESWRQAQARAAGARSVR